MEAVGTVAADVRLEMVEKPRRCDSLEFAASERALLGFFDTKQLRKAKRSSGRNLYHWFHVSRVPATKQKYVMVNYTTESEDEEEEVGPKTEVGRRPDGQGRNNPLHHKSRPFDVLSRASDRESRYPEPHDSGQRAGTPEWRQDHPVPESDGFESCRSTPFPDAPASDCELDSGGRLANQALVTSDLTLRRCPAPGTTSLSICDYVCKPACGDAKERAGRYFIKRSIYATEKDLSEPPELSLMQEHLQQLVAPTADNINPHHEGLLDPQLTAAEIQGLAQPNVPETAPSRREVVQGSRRISGGLLSDHPHGQQAQRWDRQRGGTCPHHKVANGPIPDAAGHTEEGGPDHSYLPLPEQSYVPLPDQSYLPIPEQSYLPLPEQSYPPLTEQSYLPLPEQSYPSLTEQSYLPLPEQKQSYLPLPEQSYPPLPEQSYLPLPEQSYPPLPEQSYLPLPEQKQSYLPLPDQSYLPLPDQQSGAAEEPRAEVLLPKKDNISIDGGRPGNSGGRRDKDWVGKPARPSEASFQQPPEPPVSAQLAKPMEMPSKCAEGNGKCRLNRGNEPAAKVWQVQQGRMGGGEPACTAGRVVVGARGREEPGCERCGLSGGGEKLRCDISPEHSGVSGKSPVTQAAPGKGTVDNAHPLANVRRLLSDLGDEQGRRSIPAKPAQPCPATQTRVTSPSQSRATPLSQSRATSLSQTTATPLSQTTATPLTQTTATPLTQTTATPLTQTTATPLSQTTATPLTQTTATPLTHTTATPLTQTTATPLSQTTATPLSQTTATPLTQTRRVPARKGGSGETFHGLKKLLEKKLDLNYAVLVWKDYYERKRKKEVEVKDTSLQKQVASAMASDSRQRDSLPSAAPEVKPPGPPSVPPSPPSKGGGPGDSQVVTEWNGGLKMHQDGLARCPAAEVYPCSREARGEAGPVESLEGDPYQEEEMPRCQELAPPAYNARDQTRSFSPDSMASEISLDFYTPLCQPPPSAKRYSQDMQVNRAVPTYRPPRKDAPPLPGQVHREVKVSSEQLARTAPRAEQGLKELGSRIFANIGARSASTAGEGLPEHSASRVGRCPHRSHAQPCSKCSRGVGAPTCPRAAARQGPEQMPRQGRSSSGRSSHKDISISLRRAGKPPSPECCRRHPALHDDPRRKEGRSPSLTKRSTSRKRSSGLVDLRPSHSRASDDPRHKLRSSGDLYRDAFSRQRCPTQGSVEGQDDPEDMRKCKVRVLLLVLHGGNILDTGGGDPGSKAADVGTFTSVLEKVTSVHFPAALGHFVTKLVPCPPICSEAFSLVTNLNPYSYDEGCLSSNEEHIPLSALPLLAISSPQYQDAVAMVINRTNQTYNEFLKSEGGTGFNGQVCLIGDSVGGILAFDALCYSSHAACESQNSSRRGSSGSIQDNTHLTDEPGSDLSSSKRLSKSNIDISGIEAKEPRKLLPRKQSDSSTYDCNSITQHHVFLSRIHSGALIDDPDVQRMNSTNLQDGNTCRFDFDVSDFFLFGSPLALVLAMRWTVLPSVDVAQLRPACTQVYSLFHSADPSASRLEPLLEKRFHLLPPVSVPRYQRYPLGDGTSTLLADFIQSHQSVFLESSNAPISPTTLLTQLQREIRRGSQTSISSEVSGCSENILAANIAGITSKWWGTKRIDYALYCPDALTAFPTVALPHLFHTSYWESTDVLAFVLRQVMRYESVNIKENDSKDPFAGSESSPREKWLRRRTHVKLRNVTANHRANDVIVVEGIPQMLVGRFMYGPLDMVTLTGEKVDILLMTQPPAGRWVYFDTELTSNSGRVLYTIPQEKALGVGVYPVKLVVRGDQTLAESHLTVLPKGMECVVFSIDGSFAASVSIMGSDPKVRAGAVDVVRHWQDLGYLIIYVTGRPDMQKQRVVSWLGQHNFPQGMITFSEGLVHDPLRQKTIFLRNLVQESHIKIAAAYGSMKDISVYNVLGLSPNQIYIVGRPSKKYQNQCQFLSEGYAAHLAKLEFGHRSRTKKSASRMILRKGSFGLAAQPDYLRKRTHLRRTMSVQQPEPPSCSHKPERAQSQPETDKVERHPHSIAWARSGGSKSEPGV